MDRQELGDFLRSRRERLRPEDVGLFSDARRRTPGLRREEVAVLAQISTEYYVRLEQGRAPRPSAAVLSGIAGALLLEEAESDHLHVLAGTAPTRSGLHRRDVRPSILALLERLPQTAGIVVSAAFEVLAWNDLAAALLENYADLTPRDRNLARRAFALRDAPCDPNGQRASRSDFVVKRWSTAMTDDAGFKLNAVRELRTTLTRYPTDPQVVELIDDLRSSSSEFERMWRRHDVCGSPALRKTFLNTPVGAVTVDCDSLKLVDLDQHLVLFTAPPGSTDAEKLELLAVIGVQTVGSERGR